MSMSWENTGTIKKIGITVQITRDPVGLIVEVLRVRICSHIIWSGDGAIGLIFWYKMTHITFRWAVEKFFWSEEDNWTDKAGNIVSKEQDFYIPSTVRSHTEWHNMKTAAVEAMQNLQLKWINLFYQMELMERKIWRKQVRIALFYSFKNSHLCDGRKIFSIHKQISPRSRDI